MGPYRIEIAMEQTPQPLLLSTKVSSGVESVLVFSCFLLTTHCQVSIYIRGPRTINLLRRLTAARSSLATRLARLAINLLKTYPSLDPSLLHYPAQKSCSSFSFCT